MARTIQETWTGIGFDVVSERHQRAGDDGQPIFDGHGLPKTDEFTTIVLTVPLPDGARIIRIPFDSDAKRTLLEKLTGGIVIPDATSIQI